MKAKSIRKIRNKLKPFFIQECDWRDLFGVFLDSQIKDSNKVMAFDSNHAISRYFRKYAKKYKHKHKLDGKCRITTHDWATIRTIIEKR